MCTCTAGVDAVIDVVDGQYFALVFGLVVDGRRPPVPLLSTSVRGSTRKCRNYRAYLTDIDSDVNFPETIPSGTFPKVSGNFFTNTKTAQ